MNEKERQEKVLWLSRAKLKRIRIDILDLEKEKWDYKKTKITPDPTYFTYVDPAAKEYQTLTDREKRLNNMAPVIVHAHSHSDSCLDDINEKLEQIKAEHDKATAEALAIEAEIKASISRLSNPYDRFILEYVYLVELTLKEVSERIHYSYSQTKRFHARALERLRITE